MDFLERLLLLVELLLRQLVRRVEGFLLALECLLVDLLLHLDRRVEPVIFCLDGGFGTGVDGVDLKLQSSVEPFGFGGDEGLLGFLDRGNFRVVFVHDSLLRRLEQSHLGGYVPCAAAFDSGDVLVNRAEGFVAVVSRQVEHGTRSLQGGELRRE